MDSIASLWRGASYQDHLLQSYRGFYLTVASISLGIGVGLVVAVHSFAGSYSAYWMYAALCFFSVWGVFFSIVMKRLIAARARDVDYYHNRILQFEKDLPEAAQVLTGFKVYQKFSRNNDTRVEMTDAIRAQLIEKGKGHTRKLLDSQVPMMYHALWCCLHLVALGGLLHTS
ncbi:MAG: hypothetical protein EOP56_06985 [Sphingobacteriales bacterium]|nr:MAG: hypothetical protein EOP56_06985 [Sphingobacteriales bacterium]